MTEMLVLSMMRRMNRTTAISSPAAMAMVRSKTTVSSRVVKSTAMSALGFFIMPRMVRHSLML